MNDFLKDCDLSKVTGGSDDENKLYTYYNNQVFKAKQNQRIRIVIRGDYINVPKDTKISVTYTDINLKRTSNETFYPWFIEMHYNVVS